MKEELCKAFCNEVSVREVPAGLVISTPFRRSDGDAIGFYVTRTDSLPGMMRLEDDGETIPYLEACGVDLETQTRAKAFESIMMEHEAYYDKDEAIIHTQYMRETDVPRAALRFVALMLRLSDFILLSQEHVESSFREDAVKRIREVIGDRAAISEAEPVSPKLAEVTPDLVIRGPGRTPVAVFLGQTVLRVYDAVLLQMAALYEAKEPLAVIALLEAESSVSREMRQRAANRLAAVPVYKGDEVAAIQRIEREVLGATMH